MKTLYLLRHAKSSWDNPGLADHDRPLAPRGRKAAPRIGAEMARAGLIPDLALCSTATRVRETWDLVAARWPRPVAVETRRAIYDADGADIVALVRGLDNSRERVLILGHNPALEDAAARLAGAGEPAALSAMTAKFPTAALAVLDFEADSWRDAGSGRGRLVRFLRPKDVT